MACRWSREPETQTKWIKACSFRPYFYTEPSGFWSIICDTEIKDEDGSTEVDRVWSVAKDLVTERIFTQAVLFNKLSPWAREQPQNTNIVYCYVDNYSDIEYVVKSAEEFRKRVFYPNPLYMKSYSTQENGRRNAVMRYLYCLDGDIYECLQSEGFKIINR